MRVILAFAVLVLVLCHVQVHHAVFAAQGDNFVVLGKQSKTASEMAL